MSANHCPACSVELPATSINIQEGVALCGACGKLSRLSQLFDAETDRHWLREAPRGCVLRDQGSEVVASAIARSGNAGGFAVVFAILWNSIVSVFVAFFVAELYQCVVGTQTPAAPSPAAPGGQAGSALVSGAGALGLVLFGLFLTPFVVVGIASAAVAVVVLVGRVEVSLNGDRGCVRTGIGRLSWSRRFDASRVQSVREGLSSWTQNDQHMPQIYIEADRVLKFGSLLTDERRAWMIAVLRKLLVHANAK